MRERATRLHQSAQRYERGAEGERATAAVLGELPPADWTVFHDIRWPGRRFANVDHVVVGPPGVFAIDSKNWSGRLDVQDDTLRQDGRRRDSTVAGATQGAIAIGQMTRSVPPRLVVPVLCFVRDAEVTGSAKGVLLCSTSNLVEMLSTREPQLNPAQRQQVCFDLKAALRPATERSVHREPRRSAATNKPAGRRTRPARAKSSGRAGRALLGLATAVAIGFTGVALVNTDLPNAFGRALVSLVDDTHHSDPAKDKPGHPGPSGKAGRR
ncbi:hypothetical protein GCM10022242_01810 [Nocardioides panacisoli]|uniref:NERD domain-containing protein n=2 Tax=Nocardioides panacisoli TaxID=627624 RepID=A0ABP7HVG6_9ACTN